MPTVFEANKQRQNYAWMVKRIMEEKEMAARERLLVIQHEQPALKVVYEEYLKLYDLHIKPLMPQVEQFISNMNEARKIEHFLQGQAEHLAKVEADAKRPANQTPGKRSWTLPPQVEKLPYADKDQVGKKPKKEKALTEDDAKQYMAQLKKLDPKIFDELLKQVGGK